MRVFGRGLMPGCSKIPWQLYPFRKDSTSNLTISTILFITVLFLGTYTLQVQFALQLTLDPIGVEKSQFWTQ